MKPAKHLPDTSNKLANVPELNYKKRQLKSPISPKPMGKNSAKSVCDKIEPMVLRSPPIGESVIRYALPIPSSKAKESIAEDELIRKITKHLKMVVSALEETFGFDISGKKIVEKTENEELFLSVGDAMNSFLVCCSQFATQLEEAVKEEHSILESLFQWFQVQVNQMEELSKDQSISEVETSVPEKTVILSLSQVVKQVQKLEQLRERLKHMSKYSFKAMLSKPTVSPNPPEPVKNYEMVEKMIEEFMKTHSAETPVDVSAAEPQTAYSVANQLNAMLKIFENQSNMLERTMKDHDLLEAKYNQKESDFQLLLEEKSMLENELQKLKNVEKIKTTPDQTMKMTQKMEKKKGKGKSEDLEKKKSTGKQLKIKEDLLQVQKVVFALEIENRLLQEQLKQALQEAERAKHQLEYFLSQGKDLVKNEKTKTTMEMGIGKIKVKGEDSENIPLKKERRKTAVSDSGGQKTDDEIQEQSKISVIRHGSASEQSSEKKRSSPAISDLSQILKSQDESTFSESSNEVSSGENLSGTSSSETHDRSFTTISPSKETQESLSVGTLSQENETVTASLISLTDLTRRKLTDSDTPKANVSEEKLQSKTEKQTYQEARELQGQETDEVADGSLLSLDEMLVSNHWLQIRNSFFKSDNLTLKEILAENLRLKNQDSVLNIQMQEKKQRTSSAEKRLKTRDEVTNENLTFENQDSVSETQMQLKKQRMSRVKRHKKPDEKLMLENQDSVSEIQKQIRKQKTSRGERLKTHNKDEDENLMLEHEDSVSKTEMQLKKPRTPRGERHNTLGDVPYDNLMVEQEDSVSKTQMKEKKKRTSRRKRPNKNDIERLKDAVQRDTMKEEIKKQSKVHSGKDAIQREIMKEEIKKQSNILSGVNLLKTKGLSTHQEDVLTRNISPNKLRTKVINLSLFENKANALNNEE
ncbi:coiled-coil domain-containing protein 7 [Choloepus didactylus]|uniref:coiled-coil domain-containing protein 7 n=1 Tax=Choloepus didactylus TaxID=27675 RepID=UPI00189D2BF7|nr:coiled-coil domain-containing protein 7 [Choloepus didactylus]